MTLPRAELPDLLTLTTYVPENPAARIPGVVIERVRFPRSRHRFRSRAQHRWAFATHKPWAREWAVRGRYKRLPERIGPPTLRTFR